MTLSHITVFLVLKKRPATVKVLIKVSCSFLNKSQYLFANITLEMYSHNFTLFLNQLQNIQITFLEARCRP